MDIRTLSADERKRLLEELQSEELKEQEAIKKERELYKETVSKTVTATIKAMQNVSSMLSKAKADVFNDFATLLALKKELYGYREGQQSHTFTNDEGQSIEIGCRIVDGWDDTVEAGIAKVNQYITSLVTDDKSAKLVNLIQNLLKKDAKGNLKANRVLELRNLAEELDDKLFTDGVEIINQAYKPVRSAYFIEARIKDDVGKNISIPLSITSVAFPDGITVNTDAFNDLGYDDEL